MFAFLMRTSVFLKPIYKIQYSKFYDMVPVIVKTGFHNSNYFCIPE